MAACWRHALGMASASIGMVIEQKHRAAWHISVSSGGGIVIAPSARAKKHDGAAFENKTNAASRHALNIADQRGALFARNISHRVLASVSWAASYDLHGVKRVRMFVAHKAISQASGGIIGIGAARKHRARVSGSGVSSGMNNGINKRYRRIGVAEKTTIGISISIKRIAAAYQQSYRHRAKQQRSNRHRSERKYRRM